MENILIKKIQCLSGKKKKEEEKVKFKNKKL